MTAISNGQRNTLPESHCLAKMPLNQSNSQRFTGTPSSYPWEHWQPGPHNNPDRLFRQRFPARTDFSSYRLVHRKQLLQQHFGQPCKTLWPKPEWRGFVRVLRRPIETAAQSGRSQLRCFSGPASKNLDQAHQILRPEPAGVGCSNPEIHS